MSFERFIREFLLDKSPVAMADEDLGYWEASEENRIAFGVFVKNIFWSDLHLITGNTPQGELFCGLFWREELPQWKRAIIESILEEPLLAGKETSKEIISGWLPWQVEFLPFSEEICELGPKFLACCQSTFLGLYEKMITSFLWFRRKCMEKLAYRDTLADLLATKGSSLTRFVILSYPRTGSNLLCAILNTAKDVLCLNEIFQDQHIQLYRNYRSCYFGVDLDLRSRDPDLFLNVLLLHSYAYSAEISCVGFKIFHHHLREYLQAVLKREDLKKVLLYRENKLASYSSEKLAFKTNIWFLIDRVNQSIDQEKVFFDEEDFRVYLEKVERFEKTMRERFGRDLFVLEYGEIKDEKKLKELLCFLGVKGEATIGDYLFKQNTADILERFENPDKVLSYLLKIGKENWCYENK